MDQIINIISLYLFPTFFLICFFIVLVLFPSYFKRIAGYFKSVEKSYLIALVLLVLSGFMIRAFVFENMNVQFLDEHYMLDVGNNILGGDGAVRCVEGLEHRECSPYHDVGFPLLVSIVFLIFGTSSNAVIWFNVVLGSFSIVLFGYIGMSFFGKKIGLLATMIFSFMATHSFWSSTGEKKVAAYFFSLIFMGSALYILDKGRPDKFIFLILASYAFASAIRPEFFVILFPMLFIVFYKRSEIIIRNIKSSIPKFIFFCFLIVFLLITSLLQVYMKIFMVGTGGQTNFEMFGLTFFLENIFYLFHMPYSSVLIVPFIIVVYAGFRNQISIKENFIKYYGILASIIIPLMIFLFFRYMSSRYVIFPFSFSLFFIGSSIFNTSFGKYKNTVRVLMVVLLLAFSSIAFYNISNDRSGRYDYIIDDIKSEYQGCRVFTKFSEMFVLSGEIEGLRKEDLFENEDLVYESIREHECNLFLTDHYFERFHFDIEPIEMYERDSNHEFYLYRLHGID